MKLNKKHIPSILYVFFTVLVVVLWIPFPEICHFMGASSIIYAFLFAVGAEPGFLFFLALVWIPALVINLFIWFVFASKRDKYLPFNTVVACDLLVSILILGSKIQARNYSDLGIALVGFTIRLSYFFWMINFQRTVQKGGTGDGSAC